MVKAPIFNQRTPLTRRIKMPLYKNLSTLPIQENAGKCGLIEMTKETGEKALKALDEEAQKENVYVYDVKVAITGDKYQMTATAYGTAFKR